MTSTNSPTTLIEARKLSKAALSKLNKHDLLKIVQSELTVDQSTSSVTGHAFVNTDLVAQFEIILDKKFTAFENILALKVSEIDKKVNNVTKKVEKICKDNIELSEKVSMLERKLEYSANQQRRHNFIIKGILEEGPNDDPKTAATRVIKAMKLEDQFKALGGKITEAFRLGKLKAGNNRPRIILVKLNNIDAARLITTNGKNLRAAGHEFNNVYVDRDLPPDITAALSDLRKQAYEWRRDHEGDTAYVRSGSLYINGQLTKVVKIN